MPIQDFGKVDHYFDENKVFDLPGYAQALKVIHTPGHAPGSCCFLLNEKYFGKKILIAGDTLFQNSIGRTDLPGGDMNALMKSIKEKLFVLDDDTEIITGHGPNTTIGEEKRNNPFVR